MKQQRLFLFLICAIAFILLVVYLQFINNKTSSNSSIISSSATTFVKEDKKVDETKIQQDNPPSSTTDAGLKQSTTSSHSVQEIKVPKIRDDSYYSNGLKFFNAFESTQQVESQLANIDTSNMKDQIFTSQFNERMNKGQFIDRRFDKTLYTFNDDGKLNVNHPNLKVHVKFSPDEYKDDHLKYPISTDSTIQRYCVRDNFCQGVGQTMCQLCDSKKPKLESKYFYTSWCYKPNIDFTLVSVENGILDYGAHHDIVRFNVFDANANVFSMPGGSPIEIHNGGWSVQYHAQLGTIGNVWYPDALGHFPNEILLRMVFLHIYLPIDIPIIYHDGPFANSIMDALIEKGFFPKERKFIKTKGPVFHVAKRLYFFHSKEYQHVPITPDVVVRTSTDYLKQFLYANDKLIGNSVRFDREYILVVDRLEASSRGIKNHDELVTKVKESVKGKNIDVISARLSKRQFLEIGKIFFDAKAIIAPHGAGLANLIFVKSDIKFMLEVGWVGPSAGGYFAHFFCVARAMGIKYYAVAATSGDYGSHLTVDADEIAGIVRNEFENY